MSIERLLSLIESASSKRVLFIGDTITDEYCYVSPLGKSPKENIIPVCFKDRETFEGGVDAAASHARSFCKEVVIGSFGPATRKVRMVDENYLRKLFEVHYQDGYGGRAWPKGDGFDCVAVTDFGHGEIRDARCLSKNSFLAVAVQTNSANVGFNLVTKYPRADYICIDEPEARLAAADRDSPIEAVMRKLAEGRCDKLIVTHGRHGAYGLHDGRFVHMPTHTTSVVDTMGAGDAFFAVTAPMAKEGSIEDLLTIGNAAGSLKTQILGHRESVTKAALIEYLRAHGAH